MTRNTASYVLAAAGLAFTIGCTVQTESGGAKASTGGVATVKTAVSPEILEKGRALYKANCAACHGESGKGDGAAAGALKPPPRDHTDAAYMNTLTDKNLADVIVMGGAIKGKPLMPSHPQIKGADLDALVAHVRSLSTHK